MASTKPHLMRVPVHLKIFAIFVLIFINNSDCIGNNVKTSGGNNDNNVKTMKIEAHVSGAHLKFVCHQDDDSALL